MTILYLPMAESEGVRKRGWANKAEKQNLELSILIFRLACYYQFVAIEPQPPICETAAPTN